MTGVAVPSPGSVIFHFTFLVSLHSVGGLACGATPFWSGPRHCGQFCSAEADAARKVGMPSHSAEASKPDKSKSGKQRGVFGTPIGAVDEPSFMLSLTLTFYSWLQVNGLWRERSPTLNAAQTPGLLPVLAIKKYH